MTLEQVVPTKISPESVQLCPRPWYQDGSSGALGSGRVWGAAGGVQSPLPLSALCRQSSLPAFSCSVLIMLSKRRGSLTAYSFSCSSLLRIKSLLIPWRERPQILLAQFHCTGAQQKPLGSPFAKHSCLKSLMVLIHNFPPWTAKKQQLFVLNPLKDLTQLLCCTT